MVERHEFFFGVYSDINPWINFIIVITSGDLDEAERVISLAYDSYWDNDEACSYTMADWIEKDLAANEFEYEFYFKNEEEEI